MLACVPVSVKWGHLRNIVCYFFCNALIVTTVVYSSGLLSLYNYDLLKPPFVFNCRRFNEDSDDDSAPDTSSNVSSPTENERSIGMTTQCLAENICTDQGFSSDDSESSNQESSPIFQYVEHDAPYGRQPLADMVCLLWFLSIQMMYLLPR